MNMIYEGIKQRGTIVLLPSGSLSSMSLGSVLDDLAKGALPAVSQRSSAPTEPSEKNTENKGVKQ
jgi:hypothetical protein